MSWTLKDVKKEPNHEVINKNADFIDAAAYLKTDEAKQTLLYFKNRRHKYLRYKKLNKTKRVIVLPTDTEVSTYFEYRGKIFESMKLPDGRILLQIVHTWGDGEKMKYGFQFKDGINRTGINPLHIVIIYTAPIEQVDIGIAMNEFLRNYNNSTVRESNHRIQYGPEVTVDE